MLRLSNRAYHFQTEAIDITAELVAAGEASLDEIDEATLALEKSKHLLLSKMKALQLSKLKLLEAMGCPDYIELVSIIPNDFSDLPATFNERTLLELAIKNRSRFSNEARCCSAEVR